MRFYDLIDPDLRPMVDAMPTMAWNAEMLPGIREFMRTADTGPLPEVPVTTTIEQIARADGTGSVECQVYRPAQASGSMPVIIDMHGGGYVAGSAKFGAGRNMTLAHELGCAIYSVDYRLAPEAPYPAALEDCYAVLQHVHSEAEALGIDAARIALKGDSAGGGLAAALALMARDRGKIPLVAQVLTYPMIDDRTACAEEACAYLGEYMWTTESNAFAWECYLGSKPGTAEGHYAAAARASDLSGLPPTLIGVGQLDLFVFENLEYARRLIEAGVPTELHVYPGAFHGFDAVTTSGASMGHAASIQNALKRAFKVR